MSMEDRLNVRKQVIKNLAENFADDFEGILDRRTRTCINCDYFDELTEGCQKANYQRPPARVIAEGCEMWSEELPF